MNSKNNPIYRQFLKEVCNFTEEQLYIEEEVKPVALQIREVIAGRVDPITITVIDKRMAKALKKHFFKDSKLSHIDKK